MLSYRKECSQALIVLNSEINNLKKEIELCNHRLQSLESKIKDASDNEKKSKNEFEKIKKKYYSMISKKKRKKYIILAVGSGTVALISLSYVLFKSNIVSSTIFSYAAGGSFLFGAANVINAITYLPHNISMSDLNKALSDKKNSEMSKEYISKRNAMRTSENEYIAIMNEITETTKKKKKLEKELKDKEKKKETITDFLRNYFNISPEQKLFVRGINSTYQKLSKTFVRSKVKFYSNR